MAFLSHIMLNMEQMVTIEVLQKSQNTRPRKWIPVFCFIMLLITALGAGLQALYLIPDKAIARKFLDLLPQIGFVFKNGDVSYTITFEQFTGFCILPVALLLVNLINMIVAVKICKYRRAYWWLGWMLIAAFIVMVIYVAFMNLYYLVPFIQNLIHKMPERILNLTIKLFYYAAAGYTVLYLLFLLLGIFYNVNYPSKYERIYDLRKKRIKAYTNIDERSAYKKRFYEDYRVGNWDNMLYELHSTEIENMGNEPLSPDAFECMVNYSNQSDAAINRAVYNSYASEGRYLECRRMFADLKDVGDNVNRGATVKVPGYRPVPYQQARPRQPKPLVVPQKPAPARPAQPPLRPASPRKAKGKNWGPDDI